MPVASQPSCFAVITPCNPDGERVAAGKNLSLVRKLKAELESNEFRHWPVTGYSPDMQHSEPGFGIESDLDASIDLGRRFRQEAIYWICDGQLFVVDCSDCQRAFVGDWKSRLVHANE